jgi:hypothetical protein
MSSDLVARARKALGPVAPRKDQLAGPVDPTKGAELRARARAAISAPPKQTPKETLVATPPPAPAPAPAPRAERVKLPMTCSARGVSYVVIAERRGDELRFVGHEIPQRGPGGAAPRLPGRLSGQYRIEYHGWACPLCSNTGGVWLCGCEQMNGAMHCCGTTGGRYRCACGRVEEREFVKAEKVGVRGASVAAMPGQTRPVSQGGQPQFKQVSHERGR